MVSTHILVSAFGKKYLEGSRTCDCLWQREGPLSHRKAIPSGRKGIFAPVDKKHSWPFLMVFQQKQEYDVPLSFEKPFAIVIQTVGRLEFSWGAPLICASA